MFIMSHVYVYDCLLFLTDVVGSKRGNNPALSGAANTTKGGGQLQVFHNGKIVTPQSLLPRKTASGNLSKKKIVANANNQEVDNAGEEKDTDGADTPAMLKEKKLSQKK